MQDACLKRRIDNDWAGCAFNCFDKFLGKITMRITVTFGEKLEMSNIAVTVVAVDRPLKRDALVGTGSRVPRYRRREGFEI
jgi:hypothetical protein